MENLIQNSDEAIIKKWFKFIKPFWIVSFLLAVCLIFIGYQFGIKTILQKEYQRGIEAGKLEMNNAILTNLLQFGKLQINIPVNDAGQVDPTGKQIRGVILVPEINNATTTNE